MKYEKSTKYMEKSQKGILVFSVEGEFTKGTQCLKMCEELITEVRNGLGFVVIDMGGVYYINSGGIGELINAYKQVTDAGGNLVLANLQNSVATVFLTINLFKMISYFPTVDAAVESAS